ncbi:hypothetical protein SARC_08958 [Sphaeroforma arctica JP610]|uniref:Uncharacterized protein n=1 Tax=Sphaeroforma arctica JP610 TaxID=667725 RepID=A0A0L0FP98_9EUKA|nr:hypothetical protein SARC_08958 [Sphaeroforma arctica JP610]KNC78612.1 hypothetical protein SARC_08958 [Sphaeroforma arctica JP610]|eukprot:XP_014152514.1 hypothetical protein SARC_08958 [Sphaeroforma arctica JP610]
MYRCQLEETSSGNNGDQTSHSGRQGRREQPSLPKSNCAPALGNEPHPPAVREAASEEGMDDPDLPPNCIRVSDRIMRLKKETASIMRSLRSTTQLDTQASASSASVSTSTKELPSAPATRAPGLNSKNCEKNPVLRSILRSQACPHSQVYSSPRRL